VFPSLKARQLLAVLQREPLLYRVERQKGSHRLLVSDAGYPDLRFSFHDRITLAPGAVRKILVDDIGLTPAQARKIL
jgi:predicted RNA binding protein YcfA (HicA-like mRNA interferase family)